MLVTLLLIVAFVSFGIVLGTYSLYVLVVLKNKKINHYVQSIEQMENVDIAETDLPQVTVIIPTYNEENVVSKKIQNIAQLIYPIDKLDVLVVDDQSIDATSKKAETAFEEHKLKGRVIRNPERMGPNFSYNNGLMNANSSFILRTDVDTIIQPDALLKAVKVIQQFEDVAGVTGTMMPISGSFTAATNMEQTYRDLFSKMSTSESALHSTYASGGGFSLIKKSAFSPIPIGIGSTDANISMSFVRKCLRYLYVPQVFSLEPITDQLSEQRGQKIRRASRLIQSTILNKDMFFNKKFGKFGTTIFPLRLTMFLVCPLLSVLGLFGIFFALLLISKIFFAILFVSFILCLYVGSTYRFAKLSSTASLFIQQFYLLIGLFSCKKRMSVWKSVKRSFGN